MDRNEKKVLLNTIEKAAGTGAVLECFVNITPGGDSNNTYIIIVRKKNGEYVRWFYSCGSLYWGVYSLDRNYVYEKMFEYIMGNFYNL